MSKVRRLVALIVLAAGLIPLGARASTLHDCRQAYETAAYEAALVVCLHAVNEIAANVTPDQQKADSPAWTHATWTAFVSILQAEVYQAMAAVKTGNPKLHVKGVRQLFGLDQLLGQAEQASPYEDITARIRALQALVADFAKTNLQPN